MDLETFKYRRNKFRAVEKAYLKSKDGFSKKSWALLENLETCYITKAYYALIVVAYAAIEASIKNEFGSEQKFKVSLKESGYKNDLKELADFRNSIVHDAEGKFSYLPTGIEEQELDYFCLNAMKLVHTIHFEPIKKVT